MTSKIFFYVFPYSIAVSTIELWGLIICNLCGCVCKVHVLRVCHHILWEHSEILQHAEEADRQVHTFQRDKGVDLLYKKIFSGDTIHTHERDEKSS